MVGIQSEKKMKTCADVIVVDASAKGCELALEQPAAREGAEHGRGQEAAIDKAVPPSVEDKRDAKKLNAEE